MIKAFYEKGLIEVNIDLDDCNELVDFLAQTEVLTSKILVSMGVALIDNGFTVDQVNIVFNKMLNKLSKRVSTELNNCLILENTQCFDTKYSS